MPHQPRSRKFLPNLPRAARVWAHVGGYVFLNQALCEIGGVLIINLDFKRLFRYLLSRKIEVGCYEQFLKIGYAQIWDGIRRLKRAD